MGEGLFETLPESLGVFLIELVVVVRVKQLFGFFLYLNPLDVHNARVVQTLSNGSVTREAVFINGLNFMIFGSRVDITFIGISNDYK